MLQVFKINTFLCQTHQIVNSRKVILEIVEEVNIFEKGFGSFFTFSILTISTLEFSFSSDCNAVPTVKRGSSGAPERLPVL